MDLEALHRRARERGVNPIVYWLSRAVLQPFSHLYFRLSPIKVELPPLRDRGGDLFLLFEQLIAEAAKRCGRARAPDIAPETLEALRRYRWPGNVRELQNEIQRVIALTDPGRPIVPSDLSPEIQAAAR